MRQRLRQGCFVIEATVLALAMLVQLVVALFM